MIRPLMSGEDVAAFVRGDGEGALLCAVDRGGQPHTVALPPEFRTARVAAGAGEVRDGVLYLSPLSGAWLIAGKAGENG